MNFEELNLHPSLLKAVKYLGYTELTDIQAKCIPLIQQGKDIVGQSSTGTGKTAAFGLPLLEKIVPGKGIQTLILTPTRELCVQDADTLADLSKFMQFKIVKVYGGVGIGPQKDALRYADIVVGTPGRILDHLRQRTLNLTQVKILILDEADKMFEMGFIEDVEEIIRYTPKERQTMLFSATMSDNVVHLIKNHLHSPIMIKTESYVDKTFLRQVYYDVDQRQKFSLLVYLLKNKTPGLALVFCATRNEVNVIAKNLKFQGIKVMAIHGGLTQNKREFALKLLKNEEVNVLVATDVAARGLDIKNVSHVYNYDVPKTSEEYIHRIGRTARAGASGEAVTMLSARDFDNFRRVEMDHSLEIRQGALPSFPIVRFVMEERRPFHRDGGERFSSHAHHGPRNLTDSRGATFHRNFQRRAPRSREAFRR